MVRQRRLHHGHKRKLSFIIPLLLVYVLVSAFLDLTYSGYMLNHMKRITTPTTTEETNVTKLLWEGLSRLDRLDQQRANLSKELKNIAKLANVSEEAIGPWISQLQPMRIADTPGNQTALLTCQDIAEIRISHPMGRGVTKVVELGNYRGSGVAVKRVLSTVKDVKECTKSIERGRWNKCFIFPNYKLLKEILLLQQLKHSNIVQLLGYCVQSEETGENLADHGVVSVTEMGTRFHVGRARKMDWKIRLKIAIDLASLLDYLEHSPMGSLLMADFKVEQFVWVGGKVKLTDLDDVSNVERKCIVDSDCRIDRRDVGIPCAYGSCQGLNAKHNMNGAYKTVLRHLLVHAGTEETTLREELRSMSISAASLHSRLLQLLDKELTLDSPTKT
ncbi:extracellular tyrosine-protein kinase PKDCC-like [Branchiostoma lanceolatum]|uniref:extracellular tyrosine-protein kinase PKDCC-like n=1 Tax=Branchiostoma lanceolatum TaxID=7740 RepID=UPI0034565D41